jgi:hypothetical protein
VHIAAFRPALKVPVSHGWQVRSVVASPSVATDSPGWQSVHAAHSVALGPSLNVPDGHPSQLASLVLVPMAAM